MLPSMPRINESCDIWSVSRRHSGVISYPSSRFNHLCALEGVALAPQVRYQPCAWGAAQ